MIFIQTLKNPSQHMAMMFPNYSCSRSKIHILSATKGHAQVVKIKQLTSKSVVLSRIFAITIFCFSNSVQSLSEM
uniref:Uncharacterized protein n=1 Tax=Octopus bimaculoides TaxID=37653 RepID=A0A0L8H3K0_OCTBM